MPRVVGHRRLERGAGGAVGGAIAAGAGAAGLGVRRRRRFAAEQRAKKPRLGSGTGSGSRRAAGSGTIGHRSGGAGRSIGGSSTVAISAVSSTRVPKPDGSSFQSAGRPLALPFDERCVRAPG